MLFSFSHPRNDVVTPRLFPPRLTLPWRKFLSFFIIPWKQLLSQSHYTLRNTLIQFTIHYSLHMSLTILHYRMTFFYLLLFYFVILPTSASASSVWVSFKPRASPGLSLQSYRYLGFRVVRIIEAESRTVVTRDWGERKMGGLLSRWV